MGKTAFTVFQKPLIDLFGLMGAILVYDGIPYGLGFYHTKWKIEELNHFFKEDLKSCS